MSLRVKVFLLSLAVIVVGLLGAQWYASRALERDLDARLRAQLAVHADLAALALARARAFDAPTAAPLVAELGRVLPARVTLIDPRGTVVADSALEPAAVATLENHGDRPEVREAVRTGRSLLARDSETLRAPLIYIARRMPAAPAGGATPAGAWVVRLAIAPRTVAAAHANVQRLLLVGGLIGLLAAAIVSLVTAQLLTRPVRSLTTTARAMVGDLTVRTRLHPRDELGDLATALDNLAEALANSLANLERERDRLEAILEAMVEGVLVTDAQGTIVLANRALREMFLVGRDVVGQRPIEAVRNAELYEAIGEAQRARAPVSREVAIGGVRPRKLMVRVAPLDQAEAGTVAVLSDVTELRRLETVRRDFVANVSHELRTPIAAVRAAAETLLDGALDHPEAGREFASIIDRHAARLQQLVEDLLELSRIEAKELKLELGPVDIPAAVDQAIELFELAASKKRITLVSKTTPEEMPPARADKRALGHILSNLIDNAIKYSPEGATVRITTRAREGGVRVSVTDTGMGIEARHLPRLFERFYRVDPGRSRQIGGTGLGLAIVKHLAEAMDARVSVESSVGKGSTFHVDLQAA